MERAYHDIITFGTSEPEPKTLELEAGPLSVTVIDGAVRGLSWQGTEIIRGIDCPVRDAQWATCPFSVSTTVLEADSTYFKLECCRSVSNGDVQCRLTLTGSATGSFCAEVEITAKRDFQTNRAGFVVLHPLIGITGTSLDVLHSDDSTERLGFPSAISPTQITSDIAGLTYQCQGITADIRFVGEIFEMEDQRNWGDASYKTYCRPLGLPRPYLLPADKPLHHRIDVQISGATAALKSRHKSSAWSNLRLKPTAERMPTISMALESRHSLNPTETLLVNSVRFPALQLRLHRDNIEAALDASRGLISSNTSEVELEIVVPTDQSIDVFLHNIGQRCRDLRLPITRVMAVPQTYLKSHQPNAPRPPGPTPLDACFAAKQAFPNAQIGYGVLTNFAELNRCRPADSDWNYLSHSFTALVHAADDHSVVECLDGMSEVFASSRLLAAERDYRLGLVSIGMQSNPYGAAVCPNPRQLRTPMAMVDPRQRGLFAAAWAVGAMHATEGHQIASLALSTPVGPLGMIYRRSTWAQPIYDELDTTAVYPLFHVCKFISQLSKLPRWSLQTDSSSIRSVAVKSDDGLLALITNLSNETHAIRLPRQSAVRRLDAVTFSNAIIEPNWLETSESTSCIELPLGPFNVAFLSMKGASLE